MPVPEFLPLHHIGLIILDEEHETTYKQEDGMLKYHAAVLPLRATYHRAMVRVVQPRPRSYHLALRKEYQLVELPQGLKYPHAT